MPAPPSQRIQRLDLRLTCRRSADGGAVVTLEGGDVPVRTAFDAATVAAWLAAPAGTAIPDLPARIGLARPLQELLSRSRSVLRSRAERRCRLTLEIADPADRELGALDWERSLAPALPGRPELSLLRVSAVRPRVEIPFSPPFYILDVEALDGEEETGANPLLRRSRQSLAAIAESRPASSPRVDVLFFHLPLPRGPALLSTASPEVAGTLGWLGRFSHRWRTRLVILTCRDAEDAATARRFATAALARGGPAFLLVPEGTDAAPFFAALAENLPLDIALDRLGEPVGRLSGALLFAGAGREDAFHFEPRESPSLPSGDVDESFTVRLNSVDTWRDRLNRGVESLRGWGSLLTPLTHYFPSPGERPEPAPQPPPAPAAPPGAPAAPVSTAPPPPRFLNAGLWLDTADSTLQPLDPHTGHLTVGESCHLGLQIGPRDRTLPLYGARAVPEEALGWTPEMLGIWVEIGVTGIDFDILGDPVQELWLPRGGASERVFFQVVPRIAGTPRLRYCLYHRGNVLQSFRLAALTLTPGRSAISAARWPDAALAAALGLPEGEIGGRSCQARCEYSLGDLTAPEVPARAVSIVANDLDGQAVITVKSADLFCVEIDTNNDLPAAVLAVRQALAEVSRPPVAGTDPALWEYGFGSPESANAGTPEGLDGALRQLAEKGWELFSQIVPARQREPLRQILAPAGQTLHVAHVLLEKVIPWAAIYDRPYHPNRRMDAAGQPVAHAACRAPLPRADGALPGERCGEHASCLLHPDRLAERRAAGLPGYLPETVACPLHFWGFRHILEIPPQQDGGKGDTPALQRRIAAGVPAQLAAGVNATLPLAARHTAALAALAQRARRAAGWKSTATHGDAFLYALEATDLDLIYFYGHARGGRAEPELQPPVLELQDAASSPPDRIEASELDGPLWEHHPLAILNGCGTAAFSPDALSPFIRALVRDRGAAGVLGTEIPVFEALATEVAETFLARFLDGESAGQALLAVRRALLAQNNPLGLAYTLYAAAELALAGP